MNRFRAAWRALAGKPESYAPAHEVDDAFWDGYYAALTNAMDGIAYHDQLPILSPQERLAVIDYLDSHREDALK